MPAPVLRWSGVGARYHVVREGMVDGRWFAVGEVVVCDGEARSGDRVVLVPRGFGRPCIGQVKGTRLFGSAGEPCHPARWSTVGRIVRVEPVQDCPNRPRAQAPADPPSRSANRPGGEARPGQLSLFAA